MAGGIRETQGDDLVENHEINVTPFIDVMLVLLIIFMVAAPLATVDVNVDLPVSNATPAKRPDQPVYVTVKPDLTLAIGNEDVPAGGLGAALAAATENNREERIFLRADRDVSYGDLMGVMNTLRETGYLKIALVGLEAAPPAESAAAGAGAPTQTASTPASGGAATP
ncbi:TonB system transport protein ExbD [Paracoccus sp. PS-1]|uniref:TonB system transport protein ExbD n=1 Tax=unclassified Paracoccus (in: a-proteobacteria) TaxID=2688777 RepID=UPI00048EEBA9|nr:MULTISPECIES: TonB system transport protein ExbD [unclassified Paracoccus (in: a-proteobacteria)]MDQ7263259.1 TonB system transport protein ExbD [Paracoccus sp. PS1]RQP07884.1 MAG: TonB system transport protein ExbD [Paracoccus sp. BP8]UFM65358.1 TonB system transport protein ExbD [Paracoccus sp. MA]